MSAFRDIDWRLSYDTGDVREDGAPVDILHDFYIPALARAVHYDRVAGYFRSSSLAAASQGFSALVGRSGRVRLIVGADLDPADTAAILKGDRARAEARLLAELGEPPDWSEAERRGVELLCWLVAQGWLEVRVAFRIHRRTGEALPLDAAEDGYVHSKYGILEDAAGDRIYIAGSFNESRTALCLNAENVDVHCAWRSDEAQRRVLDGAERFWRAWNNESPALRVLPLPEAVRQRLIRIGEAVTRPVELDGTTAAAGAIPAMSPVERLRFAMLRDGPKLPGGRRVGLATAPVEPWPHQAVVACRLVESFPYSWLMCDEVGLGKTIEAGLAIRSLWLSGLAQRVLIAAPASLTRQWQREMASKFLLPFGRARSGSPVRHEYLLPAEEERPARSLYEPDLAIVSTGLLARADRAAELQRAADFDLALVDEAHYARRRNPQGGTRVAADYGNLYRTITERLRPKARCLLLATATPMQLHPVEATDLLAATERAGPFLHDPSLALGYYECLGRLVSGADLLPDEWDFLRRAALLARDQDPLLWRYIEEAVIDGAIRADARQWLEHGRVPRGVSRQRMLRLIFAAAPLSRVMLRHTRGLLEIYRERGQLAANLARREVLPLQRIGFSPLEEKVYEELERYCTGLAEQLAQQAGGSRSRAALGFYLSFLRLRFASSLHAIHETLRRRLERVEATLQSLRPGTPPAGEDEDELFGDAEDDREAVEAILANRTPADLRWEAAAVRRLLEAVGDLSDTPSKMRVLLQALNDRRQAGGRIAQTVVFTRFLDTLNDIVERLRAIDPGMLIGTYSGAGGRYVDPKTRSWVGVERDEIKHRFMRGEIDLLICTDAAAEGLNLQTADLLINFDLPWNPMKVEQRIGRIDRIGQKHERIFVLNLCYLGSAEEIVYGRLLERLASAGLVVGTQQISLLPVTEDEFRQLAARELGENELLKRARERIAAAQARAASMEIPPRELFNIYARMQQAAREERPPVTLDDIWGTLSRSDWLRAIGCEAVPNLQAFVLRNIPGVRDGAVLTVSRTAYDRGIPELAESPRFASYGEPAFEAILRLAEEQPLPPALRRLSAKVDGIPAECVAYAAAVRDKSGARQIRLLTAFDQLDGVALDAAAPISNAEAAPCAARLQEIAETEFGTARRVAAIEQANQDAGAAQERLTRLVARHLLLDRQRQGHGDPNFASELKALDQIVAGRRDACRVTRVPVGPMRTISGVPFEIRCPAAGSEMVYDAPVPLLKAAVDLAARVADGMRVRKAEQMTDQVIGRL